MSATYQRGEPRTVMLPVASATPVAAGDLMATDATTGVAYPAASQTWTTDLATTQTAFALRFAAKAEQDKDANKNVFGNAAGFALKVRSSAGAVHRFACKAGTYKLGDYVGPAKQTGNLLENQIVDLVASEALAIGKVVGGEGVNPGYVEVELLSRVFRGATSIT